ncbi:MAG: carbohydrate ABC transporter permease [bacterium]
MSDYKVITLKQSKKRRQIKELSWKTLWYIILSIGAFTMLIPLLWMISTSLKVPGAVFTFPPQWIPRPVLWRNYIDAWRAVPFGRFYINSLAVAFVTTSGVLLTSSLAGYAFSRLEFPGRDKIFFLYLATMMLPGAVTMIPTFILMKNIGWVDTYKALMIPTIFTAYGTFLLRQFFMSLPSALEDAARIDGCTKLGIYWHVILPLSKPALATLGTMSFIGSWNNFMWPLIMINSVEKKTLPIGLASFQGLYSTDWTLLMAASIIVMIPALIVFVFAQRYFVEGIKLSGVKF